MTVRFGIDYYDLRAYYRDFVKTNKSMIWRKWLSALLIPFLFFVDPVFSMLSSAHNSVDSFFLCMITLLSLAWIAFILILYRNMPARLTRKVMTNPENAGIFEYVEMTFTDDEIRTKDDNSESKSSWSAIVKAKDIGTHFLLFISANQVMIVPKHKIASQNVETLESLLKAHNLLNNKIKK